MDNVKTVSDILPKALELLHNASSRTDGISGIPSGFEKLDRITSGWQNGELIAIGARPAMGKTAFVLSMAKNIAIDMKFPVSIFSLEMNEIYLANRVVSNVCEIDGEKLRSGLLAPYEWTKLENKKQEIEDAPLYIDASPNLTIEELCQKAKKSVEKNGVKLIFIDYLQLLYNNVKYTENRYLELNYFTRRLKSLAKELNIPIIITSQLNRDIEKRVGYDSLCPQLTDLRDSGTICDDCDMVCFIHRPEYFHIFQDEKGRDLHGIAEFIIAKNRNGVTANVLLKFCGEFSRFENIKENGDKCILKNFEEVDDRPF